MNNFQKISNNNIIQEFFVPIKKIKPKEEPIPEEMIKVYHTPAVPPPHHNPRVAEWITNIKKNDKTYKNCKGSGEVN